ncbi:TetR/AcrR family transcriptional regulator [Streptosporangium saharense]|uniref:AcrR family transcriptional regulator n=1 Tax=Streptosporangium saharense TaxID=1706840 RepID=A0A7W7QGY1_9ACTN|nr:TetR/AcrR family transcriptional regulator [Streptosporangium saharense]MBB4913427.1 AcrR family transcriptional regulator [Streptosporangium saharense]
MSNPGRPQPRSQPRGQARKEHILAVALKIFAENGYRGASIAEIAEGCGLSQPGLLHHFPTKADLLTAVLEYRDRLDAEKFHVDDPTPGTAALRHYVNIVEHNAHLPGLVKLFAIVTSEAAVNPAHPARDWAVGRYEKLIGGLAANLRLGVEDGSIRADVDTTAVARLVFSMMDGLQLQWLLNPDRVDMPGLFRTFIDELTTEITTPDR